MLLLKMKENLRNRLSTALLPPAFPKCNCSVYKPKYVSYSQWRKNRRGQDTGRHQQNKSDCTLTLKQLPQLQIMGPSRKKTSKCKAAGRQTFGFLVFQLEKFVVCSTLGSFYIKTVRNDFSYAVFFVQLILDGNWNVLNETKLTK